MHYLGEMNRGTGSRLNVGWERPARLQLTLMYTGLLSLSAVAMAVSICEVVHDGLHTIHVAWR